MPATRIRDRLLRRRDTLVPPVAADSLGCGPAGFRRSGDELVARAVAGAGLLPGSSVLDAGCGWGRVARPLTRLVRADVGGGYEGFDVDDEAIAWCAQAYARFPAFRFAHADLVNARYRPQGAGRASEFVFPYEDDHFDVVFATALLTHLVTAEASRYLHEIGRVLRPGGHLLATLLLLDHNSRAAVTRGAALFALRLDAAAGPMTLLDPDLPEALVGYDRDWLRQECAAVGLDWIEVADGGWRGASTQAIEDLVILRAQP